MYRVYLTHQDEQDGKPYATVHRFEVLASGVLWIEDEAVEIWLGSWFAVVGDDED